MLTRKSLIFCSLFASSAAIFPGCFEDDSREIRLRQVESFEELERTDSIGKAMKYLPFIMRFDRTTAAKEVLNQLNAWSTPREDSSPWKRPALIDTVAADIRNDPLFARLGSMEFGEAECEYLLQSQMMSDLGFWINERPYLDPLFQPWLEKQKGKLSADEGAALEKTLKLFDWTVRNVALEGTAKDVEALPLNPSMPLTDLGMGYRALPWQTLHFGRGDAYQRGRVFTQLLFQQGIPAVMLALPMKTVTEPLKSFPLSDLHLWAIGALIGSEVYLFEPRWGLPFPNADEPAVATLRQAKSDPNVLRRAKLPGRFDYPIGSADLKSLVAFIDVEPFSVGRSVQALQQSLTGENRMQVATDVTSIASKLAVIDPSLDVRLWELPWLSQLYNQSVRNRINDRSSFSINYQITYGAYMNESLVSDARTAHFKGNFETTIDADGAAKKYMNLRIDEETLAKLAYDRDIQQELQMIRKPNETQEEYQYRVGQAQGFYRTAKLDSNAFLGMLQFDLQNLEASTNWMDQRLLQIDGTERWRPQARYILGRVYEQKKEFDESFSWYKMDGSPQEAGNRIRMRLLEKINANK